MYMTAELALAAMKECPMNMNACKLKKIETIGRVRTAKDTQSALTGPYIAGGRRGQLPPPGKLNVFFLT